MKIKSYTNLSIETLHGTNGYPLETIQRAMDITMKGSLPSGQMKPASRKNIKFLLFAKHTSIFEHVIYQAYISNMSRSLQMQLVRHRMASYTMSSQHYQDSRDYNMMIHPIYANDKIFDSILKDSNTNYKSLIDDCNVPPEEARQILPQAKASHGIITINCRSLVNLLNVRLCRRNVVEMQIFAQKLWAAVNLWFPELFDLVHADCVMYGKCYQGHMSCNRPFNTLEDKPWVT